MITKTIRSRIIEFFPIELQEKMYKLCRSSKTSDNNEKVNLMLGLLDAYDVNYEELGPGTNRLAVLIDGYVFKIALDKWGIKDNINEFCLSKELQPYVIKVYECNDLIMVCEYVTVISKEEFKERKSEIKEILNELSNSYLLGDIGTVEKNFCNWGYRDNDEITALDFAYIYRVIGDEMLCGRCFNEGRSVLLGYDSNFHKLVCPHCNKTYNFIDIRRKVPLSIEEQENKTYKNELCYKVTQSVEKITIEDEDIEKEEEKVYTYKEEFNMAKWKKEKTYLDLSKDVEDRNNDYMEMLNLLKESGNVKEYSINRIDIPKATRNDQRQNNNNNNNRNQRNNNRQNNNFNNSNKFNKGNNIKEKILNKAMNELYETDKAQLSNIKDVGSNDVVTNMNIDERTIGLTENSTVKVDEDIKMVRDEIVRVAKETDIRKVEEKVDDIKETVETIEDKVDKIVENVSGENKEEVQEEPIEEKKSEEGTKQMSIDDIASSLADEEKTPNMMSIGIDDSDEDPSTSINIGNINVNNNIVYSSSTEEEEGGINPSMAELEKYAKELMNDEEVE